MKILETFCGYGTSSCAIKRIGFDYELVGYSDIDKYANQCFKQNHCPDDVNDLLRLGDITKVNPTTINDFDLLAGGFPCQAFSTAGLGLGELDTRGTLFNEIIRIAEVKQPRYMLLENVKGLTNKKHKPTFDKIISELYRIGYFVKYKLLNTKNYGIPQSRERIFFACFKNWNDFCKFEFPKEEPLTLMLKDILEDSTSQKFNLTESSYKNYNRDFGSKGKVLKGEDVTQTLTSAMGNGGGNIPVIDKKYYLSEKAMLGISNSEYRERQPQDPNSICGCLKVGGDVKCIPVACASRGRNPLNPSDKTPGVKKEQRIEFRKDEISNCLTTVQKDNYVFDGQLRRLTPTECFRLQGFRDGELNLDGLSDTQKYKLAGNGQSVNVVEKIYRKMLI